MSLRELYQEMIVDHGKQPRNFGFLPNANCCQVGHNRLCGDKLTLYVYKVNEVVLDLRFEGSGCAISMASASLMTEAVKGKSLEEIHSLHGRFHRVVTEGVVDDDLGKLSVLTGVSEYPARIKCATLAWHTLQAALSNQTQTVSTEEKNS